MKKILLTFLMVIFINELNSSATETIDKNFLNHMGLPHGNSQLINEYIKRGVSNKALSEALIPSIAYIKYEAIKTLLDHNANPNITDSNGDSPLIYAITRLTVQPSPSAEGIKNLIKIIKELILHGALTNIPGSDGETAQTIFAKLKPELQKEIEDAINEDIAKHKKGIEEATGLPKELAELTAQQLFGELKPTPKVTPENRD